MRAPGLHEVDVRGAPVRALFSGSDLDVGTNGASEEAAVRRNRSRLARAAGFDSDRAVVLEQVHGAEAVTVAGDGGRGTYAGTLAGFARADASVTRVPGVALLALGADCAPVLLWSADEAVVAGAHAGWRGLLAGVLLSAVGEMAVAPTTVRAAIGPCIGACCYPVGAGLRRTMSDRFGTDVVVGEAVDLRLAAHRSLAECGVDAAAIQSIGECTACGDGAWFSYRRDGTSTGRHAGVVWIEEDA